jgi:hypothetical protein
MLGLGMASRVRKWVMGNEGWTVLEDGRAGEVVDAPQLSGRSDRQPYGELQKHGRG